MQAPPLLQAAAPAACRVPPLGCAHPPGPCRCGRTAWCRRPGPGSSQPRRPPPSARHTGGCSSASACGGGRRRRSCWARAVPSLSLGCTAVPSMPCPAALMLDQRKRQLQSRAGSTAAPPPAATAPRPHPLPVVVVPHPLLRGEARRQRGPPQLHDARRPQLHLVLPPPAEHARVAAHRGKVGAAGEGGGRVVVVGMEVRAQKLGRDDD